MKNEDQNNAHEADAMRAPPFAVSASVNSISPKETDKLDIRGGRIHFRIRQQDDSFLPVSLPDKPEMRSFVQWVQIHD